MRKFRERSIGLAALFFLALFLNSQAQAALSTGCQLVNSRNGGTYNVVATSGQSFNAGEVITVTSSSGYMYYNFTTSFSSSFTHVSGTLVINVATTGVMYLRVYTTNSSYSDDPTATVTTSCVARSTATGVSAKTQATAAASHTLNTQMSTALPSAEIGNIMRRIDAALPVAPAATGTDGGAAAPSQSSRNQFASAPNGMQVTGMPPVAADAGAGFSLMADDAGSRIAGGQTMDHRNDFAAFASLGVFSFKLGEEAPQAGSPERQRIQSLPGTSGQMTVWGQGAVTALSNSAAGTEYSGQILSYTVGADYKPNTTFVAGGAFNYADTDIVTSYNAGRYREKSYTVLPYAAWRPDDVYTVQVVGGIADSFIGSDRNDSSSGYVTGDTGALSWFLSGTGTARVNGEGTPWRIEARLAALVGRRYVRSYTETDGTANQGTVSTTVQLRPGLEVSYRIEMDAVTLEPYARAEQIWDLGDALNGDHTAWNAVGGLRAMQGPVFGSIEYDQELGRQDYFARTLSGLIGYHFLLGPDQGTLSPQLQAGVENGMQHIGMGLSYEPVQLVVFDLGVDKYDATNVLADTTANLLNPGYAQALGAVASSTLYRLRVKAPF